MQNKKIIIGIGGNLKSEEGAHPIKVAMKAISYFKDYLIKHNFIATVRVTRGDEIDGACGQLVGKLINPIGSKKLKNKQISAQNLH